MSQSATWDTLLMAREFEAAGRPVEAAIMLAEVDAELVEYVRRTGGLLCLGFYLGDDEDYDARPVGEQVATHRRYVEGLNRMPSGWIDPTQLSLVSFDSMLKEHYTPDMVSQLSLARNPAIGMLAR